MNILAKSAPIVLGCLLAAVCHVQAQLPAKAAQNGARALTNNAAKTITGPISPKLSGFLPAGTGEIKISAAALSVSAPAGLSAAAPRINQEKLQNALGKIQQTRAAQKCTLWGANTLLHREDLLRSYHLPEGYLEGFFMKRIFPYQSSPNYIADKKSDEILYRGMLITPEELAKILKEGFSPVHSKWNAGTDGRPAVSLSSSSVEATHYIFQSGSKRNGIGVVFEVRRKPSMELGKDPVLNRTKTIYYSYEDIPPEDIVDVLVWGEYGLESLDKIFENAQEGTLKPHTAWTGQFGRMLF